MKFALDETFFIEAKAIYSFLFRIDTDLDVDTDYSQTYKKLN